jgi:hypothetical protein
LACAECDEESAGRTDGQTSGPGRPIHWLKAFWYRAYRENVTGLSAMVAYNLLLAVFPFSLLVLFIFSQVLKVEGIEASVYADLQRLFPSASENTLRDILDSIRTNSAAIGVVAIAASIWIGASFWGAMDTAFCRIYHVRCRGWWEQKRFSLVMLLVVVAFFLGTVILPAIEGALLRSTDGLPFGLDEVVVVRVARPGEEAVLPAAVTAGEVGRPRKPGVMSGRLTSAARRALADLYGGTPESEAAVARGLAWLARVQQPEGSWTLKGGSGTPSPDAPSDPEPPADPTLATALAVLPFLGEGISHQRAPTEPAEYQNYKTVVEKGLVFLCMNQTRDRSKADGFLKGGMEGHSLATIAIAEDYALSRDDRLKLHIRQAVKFLGAMQNQDGSWGREPGGQGDLVTTCWAVQALRAVQAAADLARGWLLASWTSAPFANLRMCKR